MNRRRHWGKTHNFIRIPAVNSVGTKVTDQRRFTRDNVQAGVRGFHATTFHVTKHKHCSTATLHVLHGETSLPLPNHTHASSSSSHPLYTLATTHANTQHPTPTCPGLPQLLEPGHGLGEAQSSLHLAASGVYSARGARWEVRTASAGPLSGSEAAPWRNYLWLVRFYRYLVHT